MLFHGGRREFHSKRTLRVGDSFRALLALLGTPMWKSAPLKSEKCLQCIWKSYFSKWAHKRFHLEYERQSGLPTLSQVFRSVNPIESVSTVIGQARRSYVWPGYYHFLWRKVGRTKNTQTCVGKISNTVWRVWTTKWTVEKAINTSTKKHLINYAENDI